VGRQLRFELADGFTLHAATRAGALHPAGREALLRYVLRPPIAQQRLEHGAGDLVRITLKRAYADGTVAVEMDPLSLLCRLATSLPPPRFHTVKAGGCRGVGGLRNDSKLLSVASRSALFFRLVFPVDDSQAFAHFDMQPLDAARCVVFERDQHRLVTE
jgi:hypothetical protein